MARGAGLLAVGVLVLALDVHAIATYRAPAGTQQSATLGQVVAAVFGVGLLVIGGALVGGVLRRKLAIRRVRRLRDRLAADGAADGRS